MHTWRRICTFVAALTLFASLLQAETLTLSSSFVKQVKNKATLPIHLELDAHLTTPHAISKSGDDGDIHMAGRADEVQLPMVAEIMNAGLTPQAGSVTAMNQASTGQIIPITGVWRIWFEHPSPGDQVQGDAVDVPVNSNPDHVFEIHPITNFGGQDIADSSLIPIANDQSTYQAYPAHVAFAAYEKLKATISGSDTSVSITSTKAGYNYAEFIIELAGQPQLASQADPNDNGIFVLANVYDVDDPEQAVTADVRRMVFVENTEPAKQVQALSKGGRMHVLGIPRVNLAEVDAIATGGSVDTVLPYEMIIVGILSDSEASSGAPAPASKHQPGNAAKKRTQPDENN
jgi:hypothetical protein